MRSEVHISVPNDEYSNLWENNLEVPAKDSIYNLLKIYKLQCSVPGELDFGSGITTDRAFFQLPFKGVVKSLMVYNISGSVDITVKLKRGINDVGADIIGLVGVTSSNTPVKVNAISDNVFEAETFIEITRANNLASTDLFYSVELERIE